MPVQLFVWSCEELDQSTDPAEKHLFILSLVFLIQIRPSLWLLPYCIKGCASTKQEVAQEQLGMNHLSNFSSTVISSGCSQWLCGLQSHLGQWKGYMMMMMVPFICLSSLCTSCWYWQGLTMQLTQFREPNQLKTDETTWKVSTSFFFWFFFP